MDAELLAKAGRYAAFRGLELGPSLGDGIHGIVLRAKYHRKPVEVALKIHSDAHAFLREVDTYERLAQDGVIDILSFNVPMVIHSDEQFLAIEMTIVSRPFVLDFAAAYLDRAPHFSEDALKLWEQEKREQFGDRWETVRRILAELREMGIHQTDVSPGNIGFAEGE